MLQLASFQRQVSAHRVRRQFEPNYAYSFDVSRQEREVLSSNVRNPASRSVIAEIPASSIRLNLQQSRRLICDKREPDSAKCPVTLGQCVGRDGRPPLKSVRSPPLEVQESCCVRWYLLAAWRYHDQMKLPRVLRLLLRQRHLKFGRRRRTTPEAQRIITAARSTSESIFALILPPGVTTSSAVTGTNPLLQLHWKDDRLRGKQRRSFARNCEELQSRYGIIASQAKFPEEVLRPSTPFMRKRFSRRQFPRF